MGITQIQVVSIPVSDQERAKRFYVDTLGFAVRNDSPMGPEQRWVEVAPPGAATSLALVTWFPTMSPGTVKGLVLDCRDIDTTRDELAAKGVHFQQPIQQAPWGRFTTFDDPDGNGWVLAEGPTKDAT